MHKEKFNEFVDETIDSFPLGSTVQNVIISTLTHNDLEQTNQDIYFVLKKVRKKIEGQKNGFPHSKEEVKRRAVILCWKSRLLKSQGKPYDRTAIENRK